MVKINQSLIKSLNDYINQKECGLVFKAKFIDKDPLAYGMPSDAMKTGIYFEYLCTGALPKSNEIPIPDVVYKGTAKEKLSAPYERAVQSSMIFKQIIQHYNIEIIEQGKEISNERISGVIDIFANWNGKPCIIDLKYSGLIDDKWNEMGWDLESLPMKDSICIQAVHYKLLAEEVLGIVDIPFYFFVFSSSDPYNIKIIEMVIDPDKYENHRNDIDKIIYNLELMIGNGFKAYPSLTKCNSCPLKPTCTSAIDYPKIEIVYY